MISKYTVFSYHLLPITVGMNSVQAELVNQTCEEGSISHPLDWNTLYEERILKSSKAGAHFLYKQRKYKLLDV